MRSLFLTLILLNLLVFFWFTKAPSAPETLEEPPGTSTGAYSSLKLLSEQREEVEVMASSKCWKIGPFLRQIEAKQVSDGLAEVHVSTKLRANKAGFRKGFWVRLASSEEYQKAKESLGQLRAKGVSDSQVVEVTQDAYTVSLGLFSSRKGAMRRHLEMKALGVDSVLVDRSFVKKHFWVESQTNLSGWLKSIEAQVGYALQIKSCS